MLVKGIKAGSVLVIELWLKLWLGLWLLRDNEKTMYLNHRLLGCMSKVVSITCANATTHFTSESRLQETLFYLDTTLAARPISSAYRAALLTPDFGP